MTNQREMYYTNAGEPVGPLPAYGEWPTKYEVRGLHLVPPRLTAYFCALEDCDEHQDNPGAEGFQSEALFLAHCREAHNSEVWKNLATGELAYQPIEGEPDEEVTVQPVAVAPVTAGTAPANFTTLTYKQLQALARERGLPFTVKREVLIESLSG